MKKLALVALAFGLSGCAAQREYVADHIRPQRHVVPAVKAAAVPAPKPVVVLAPDPKPVPVTTTKLAEPRWYDRFQARVHHKKGN
jgi:hypothetical protein